MMANHQLYYGGKPEEVRTTRMHEHIHFVQRSYFVGLSMIKKTFKSNSFLMLTSAVQSTPSGLVSIYTCTQTIEGTVSDE